MQKKSIQIRKNSIKKCTFKYIGYLTNHLITVNIKLKYYLKNLLILC